MEERLPRELDFDLPLSAMRLLKRQCGVNAPDPIRLGPSPLLVRADGSVPIAEPIIVTAGFFVLART